MSEGALGVEGEAVFSINPSELPIPFFFLYMVNIP